MKTNKIKIAALGILARCGFQDRIKFRQFL